MIVHGDDFTALGADQGLNMYEAGMMKAFDIKLRGRIGTGDHGLKEVQILNRILRVVDDGLAYEADPRHVELLARALGLEDCGLVTTQARRESRQRRSQITSPATKKKFSVRTAAVPQGVPTPGSKCSPGTRSQPPR